MIALITLGVFISGTLFGLYLPKLFNKFVYDDIHHEIIQKGIKRVTENQN